MKKRFYSILASLLILLAIVSLAIAQARPSFHIFEISPKNPQEFRKIFNRDGRASDWKQLDDYRRRLEDLRRNSNDSEIFNAFSISSPKSLSLLDLSLRLNQKTTIIIGHNVDGIFYMPNGDRIALKDFELYPTKYPIVILSCRSKDSIPHQSKNLIGIKSALTYKEAFEIAHDLLTKDYSPLLDIVNPNVARMASLAIDKLRINNTDPKHVSLSNEESEIENRLHASERRLKIKLSIEKYDSPDILGVSLYIVYKLTSDDKDKRKH